MAILNILLKYKTNRPQIIATIENDKLTISTKTFDLENYTLYKNRIFKPAILVSHLKKYLQKITDKNPEIAIRLPQYPNIPEFDILFIALQYTLVFSKAGFCITSVTVANNKTNLLNTICKQQKGNPKLWIFLTALTAVTGSFTIWCKQSEISTHLEMLKTIKQEAVNTNLIYTKQASEVETLKNEIKELKKKQSNSQKAVKNLINPKNALQSLANYTPQSIWLTSVDICNKEKNKIKQNRRKVNIKGVSLNSASISRFLNNLTNKKSGIKKAKLVFANKKKREQDKKYPVPAKKFYVFNIEGDLSKR